MSWRIAGILLVAQTSCYPGVEFAHIEDVASVRNSGVEAVNYLIQRRCLALVHNEADDTSDVEESVLVYLSSSETIKISQTMIQKMHCKFFLLAQ